MSTVNKVLKMRKSKKRYFILNNSIWFFLNLELCKNRFDGLDIKMVDNIFNSLRETSEY